MLNSRVEYDRMAQADVKHWWYATLHLLVLRSIRLNFKNNKDIKLLDAGCGTGGLMLYLAKHGYRNVYGMDISKKALEYCHKRSLNVTCANIIDIGSICPPSSFDVIVCNDVLYFLEEGQQRKTIYSFYTILKPGGVLLFNFPVMDIFQGIHDLSVGIKKRHQLADILKLLPDETINNCNYSYRYWPVLLSPAILVNRFFQRRKIKKGTYSLISDVEIPGSATNHILKGLMAIETRLPTLVNFGSSVFLTVWKPLN